MTAYEITGANGALIITQYGYKVLSDLSFGTDTEQYTVNSKRSVPFSALEAEAAELLRTDGSEFSDTETVTVYDAIADNGEPCEIYVPDSWF